MASCRRWAGPEGWDRPAWEGHGQGAFLSVRKLGARAEGAVGQAQSWAVPVMWCMQGQEGRKEKPGEVAGAGLTQDVLSGNETLALRVRAQG